MIHIIALIVSGVAFVWLWPGGNIENPLLAAGKHSSEKMKNKYQKDIEILDLSVTPETIIGIKYCGVLISLITTVFLFKHSFFYGMAGITVTLAAWVLPDKWLAYKESLRINDLNREFPLMVTLVRVYAKAADLYKALLITRDAVQGELKKQMDILATELTVYPLHQALDNFAARCNYLPISNFVSVVQFGIITGSDVDEILSTFSKRVYKSRVDTIKRRIKMRPIIMTVIPAFMILTIALLLIVPMFTNIIIRLNSF